MKGSMMIETVYSLLTDESTRSAIAVETLLAEQVSAGVPWFDDAS